MSPKHTAGLTMSIPVFSGMQRDSKVKQAKITLEQTYLQKDLLEDQLNVERSVAVQAAKRANGRTVSDMPDVPGESLIEQEDDFGGR